MPGPAPDAEGVRVQALHWQGSGKLFFRHVQKIYRKKKLSSALDAIMWTYPFFQVVEDCGAPCYHNITFFNKPDIQTAHVWIFSWSLLCLVSCLFTLGKKIWKYWNTFAKNYTNLSSFYERPYLVNLRFFSSDFFHRHVSVPVSWASNHLPRVVPLLHSHRFHHRLRPRRGYHLQRGRRKQEHELPHRKDD